MNDAARDALRAIISRHGQAVCNDPRRLRGLLTDHCPGMKREVHLLSVALEQRLVDELLRSSAGVPWPALAGRLVRRMADDLGVTEDAARWTVEAWGVALGKCSPGSVPPPSRGPTTGNSSGTSTAAGPVPPPSKGRAWLVRWSPVLVGVYALPFIITTVIVIFNYLISKANEYTSTLVAWAIFCLIFFGCQFLFLLGAPPLFKPNAAGPRSIITSVVVGTLLMILILGGLTATLGSVASHLEQGWVLILVLCSILACWAVWGALLFAIYRAPRDVRFKRMYQALFAGSCLELLVTIPADAWVRKQTRCWCEEGSFFGLIVGITMVMWSFGPGIALLFLVRRRQRADQLHICVKCGNGRRYPKAAYCPHCGNPFDDESLTQTVV
jgi:hypothetical protein